MSITFVIPSMRPIMVKRVLHDLDNQTLRPSRVILVDNSTQYQGSNDYQYELEVRRPGKNLGTNPVWNIALRLEDDYCGILGDDYRLEPTMVEKMVYGLNLKYGNNIEAGAVVPEIVQQQKRKPLKINHVELENLKGLLIGNAKGRCSAVLMIRDVANDVPLIPDHFNIFFGDNWIGYHIMKMGLGFVQLYPCFIYHIPGANNVSASLNYKGVLKHERVFWKEFVRSEATR